jgi:hypothetical protein
VGAGPGAAHGGTGGGAGPGAQPRDNHDELMEFVELKWLLQDIETYHITEAARLAALVREVSQVLENLGLPPSRDSLRIHV